MIARGRIVDRASAFAPRRAAGVDGALRQALHALALATELDAA